MTPSYLGKKNFWVPIKKFQTAISIKKGKLLSIKPTHFLLTLAWSFTNHEVQSLGIEWCVTEKISHGKKIKKFQPGKMYTALGRVKTFDNLYLIREFKKSVI